MLTKLLSLLAQIGRSDGDDEVDGALGSEIRCVRLQCYYEWLCRWWQDEEYY